MSAKEMFKKLGYKLLIENDCEIMFYTDKHSVVISKLHKDMYVTNLIDLELLQAINKQVEELGWNNE